MALNDQIQDDFIRRAIYVQRYTEYEVKRMNALLTAGRRAIRRTLLDADITAWSRSRYEALNKSLSDIMRTTTSRMEGTLKDTLQKFGEQEVVATTAMMSARIPIKWDFTTPSMNQVWAAANARPVMLIDGTTLSINQILKGFSTKQVSIVQQGLRQGYLLGKPSAQIARELASTTAPLGKRTADLITRTTLNHLSQIAHKKTAEDNNDIVKGYQWVSVLDKNTSAVCQSRDGQSWIYSDDERGKFVGDLLPGEVYPPAHYSCRSTITYITASWKELGIDKEEVPASTRASMNGQVPERTAYKEWIQRQPVSVQKEVLGVKRTEMLNAGEIKIDKFYASDGRMYTLSELDSLGYDVYA